jgi:hypothetical protein
MLFSSRRAWAAGTALTLALLGLSCNKSDSVTNPMGSPAASADVAGNWSGTFQARTAGCTSPVTATLQQSGANVQGIFAADNCKIRGAFFGTVSGKSLIGKIEMTGCKGGAVMGTASASAVSMEVGDFWSPADFGDKILLYGGTVTLQK